MTAKDQCVVRLDNGQMVTAATTSALESGAPCLLSIRPERVQVNADAGVANRFDTTVQSLIYLGDHVRLTLSFFDEELIAKVPANNDSIAYRRVDAGRLGLAGLPGPALWARQSNQRRRPTIDCP